MVKYSFGFFFLYFVKSIGFLIHSFVHYLVLDILLVHEEEIGGSSDLLSSLNLSFVFVNVSNLAVYGGTLE